MLYYYYLKIIGPIVKTSRAHTYIYIYIYSVRQTTTHPHTHKQFPYSGRSKNVPQWSFIHIYILVYKSFSASIVCEICCAVVATTTAPVCTCSLYECMVYMRFPSENGMNRKYATHFGLCVCICLFSNAVTTTSPCSVLNNGHLHRHTRDWISGLLLFYWLHP